MRLKLSALIPFTILLLPIAIFFYPVWFQGKLPLPADTIPGLYHPMRDALADIYPNGPPYKNFLITDSVRQQYPWRQFSIAQLKSGHLPWWNPYNFAGTPHIANFQSATFYPGNLIFWIFDFTSGWNLLVILQPLLGAIFLYLYLKHLELAPLAAIFGSIVWIFSGFFVVWLEWNTAAHVALWSPLILLSIDHLLYRKDSGVNSPGIKSIIWPLILLFALISQFLAGYPQPWVYLTLLQLAYIAWRISPHLNVITIVKISTIYLLFMIIISPQLLTTLRFSKLSNRIYDQGDLLHKPDWFLPYQNLVQLVAPDYFGNPATLNYWGVFNYTEFVSYIGWAATVMVLVAWSSKKRSQEVLFFTLFTGLSLLMATKNPLSILQFKFNLPFISSSQPSRWLVVTDLSLAITAALGMHAYLSKKTRLLLPTAVSAIILGLIWLITFKPQLLGLSITTQNLSITYRNLILPSLELAAVLSILISSPFIYLLLRRLLTSISKPLAKLLSSYQVLATILLIILTSTVGLRFAWKFTPFSDRQFLYPPTQILTYLQTHAGLYRYMTTDRRIMAPNFNLAYNLYTVEGYDPLYLENYGQLIYASEQTNFPDKSKPFNRIVATDNFNSPIIDLLGVKYILSLNELNSSQLELIMTEGETKLYQNQHVLPRAFITGDINPYQLTHIFSADISSYAPNQVVITTTDSPAGTLILSDAWYPDWQATVDNHSTTPINWYGLKAVNLSAGSHRVVFTYQPRFL